MRSDITSEVKENDLRKRLNEKLKVGEERLASVPFPILGGLNDQFNLILVGTTFTFSATWRHNISLIVWLPIGVFW